MTAAAQAAKTKAAAKGTNGATAASAARHLAVLTTVLVALKVDKKAIEGARTVDDKKKLLDNETAKASEAKQQLYDCTDCKKAFSEAAYVAAGKACPYCLSSEDKPEVLKPGTKRAEDVAQALQQLRDWTEDDLNDRTQKIIGLRGQWNMATWEMAKLLYTTKTDEIWRVGGYKDAFDYFERACGMQEATYKTWLKVAETYDDETIQKIGMYNARLIVGLPTPAREAMVVDIVKKRPTTREVQKWLKAKRQTDGRADGRSRNSGRPPTRVTAQALRELRAKRIPLPKTGDDPVVKTLMGDLAISIGRDKDEIVLKFVVAEDGAAAD